MMLEDALVQDVIARLVEELVEAHRNGCLDDLQGITYCTRGTLFISQVEE
jgi:hypothetical protein